MTGIDPDRLQRRLRWAAEQLGLSPHASADEVRAAWLRRLPEEDFVPSSELRWALAALLRRQPEGGWEARADEAAFAAEEERLRDEVEAFAEQFWDLPADERRRRWEKLTDCCAFAPTLRARLRLLEAGLAIDPHTPSEDARVAELASHVRELFVLRPGPRAHARQDILRRMENEREKWKTAVRRLRYACPALASLGADLLNKLETAMPTPQRLPKRPPPPQSTASASTGGQVPRWIFIVIAVAASQIARVACDHSPPPPTMPTRPWQDNRDQKFPPAIGEKADEFRPFTNEERKKRIEEELRRERKQSEARHDKTDGKSP